MAKDFDIGRAMADPSAFFAQPADVIAQRGLSRSTKLKLLRHWEHDARSLAVAESEGMSGGEESMHGRVLDAIQTLETGGMAHRSWSAPFRWMFEGRGAVASMLHGTREQPVAGLLIAAITGYVVGRIWSRR